MAFGEQQPMIQIQVDQRLALESAVHGDVEDTSVSTEITQFDKVGDSYILEGVLAFAGKLQEPFRNSEDAGEKAPFEYRLPFALRIPVEGQPDYLKVNTRIRDWKLEHSEPSSLNFQAELTILGLTGNRGYYFYCGDQEDWVQPIPEELESVTDVADIFVDDSDDFETADESAETETEMPYEVQAAPDNLIEAEVDGLRSAADQEPSAETVQSYNEQEWLIESADANDEQDTLVYQPGWQVDLQSALAGNYVQEEADENRGVETAEDEFQFEALADEVIAVNAAEEYLPTAEQVESASATAVEADDESVQAVMAQAEAVDQPAAEETTSELVSADAATAQPSIDADEEIAEAAESQVTSDTKLAEAKTDGPKLSFGKPKEEWSPVKLSGLLYGGSVTERVPQVETTPAPKAREASTNEAVASAVSNTEAVASEVTDVEGEAAANVSSNELASNAAEGEAVVAVAADSEEESASPSIWGKWIQTDSALTYTIKFRIVQEEETLQDLANGYNTPIETLMRANGLTNENIDVGQVLLIPGRR